MRIAPLASALLLSCSVVAPAAGEAVKEVRKTVPLEPDGRVVVETFKGSIDVETWDRPEVDIAARVEPDETGRHQAEKVEETEIRIEGSGRRVFIESDYDRARHRGFLGVFGDDGTLPFVRYTIRLPKGARLEVKDYKSVSRLRNLGGGLEMSTYKGRVEITGASGPIELETYKGEVTADFERFAASRFETYKGNIDISMPSTAAFDLDADVGRRGRLHSDLELTTRLSRSDDGERLRATANGGGATLELETYRGTFRLHSE